MIVVILMGCSGSGKSTYSRKLLADLGILEGEVGRLRHYPMRRRALILSADDLCLQEGKFRPENLEGAHRECLRRYQSELLANSYLELLIVDNTNVITAEVAPYVALGLLCAEVDLRVVAITGAWELCSSRSLHGAAGHVVRRQSERLDRTLREWPRYWPSPCVVSVEG